MKFYILISGVLLFVFISSCADWESQTNIIKSGGIISNNVILIEEFTGTSCPNCPSGTAEVESIKDKYPNNVVIIGVHSKFLAQPVNVADPDLRTVDANKIESFLGNYQGKPEVSINRQIYSGKSMIRLGITDPWLSYVEDELRKENLASLIISNSYNDNTRELMINVKAMATKNIDFPTYLHVAITESEIHAAQKNNTGVFDNYIHNDVLHNLLTPVEGELFFNSLLNTENSSKEYKFTLPAESKFWIAKNCHVVAFLSKDQSLKSVIQASQANVK
ncbi:MAG: Omp28-related outer membrane protein, partial [Saprospiraceae bacterium]